MNRLSQKLEHLIVECVASSVVILALWLALVRNLNFLIETTLAVVRSIPPSLKTSAILIVLLIVAGAIARGFRHAGRWLHTREFVPLVDGPLIAVLASSAVYFIAFDSADRGAFISLAVALTASTLRLGSILGEPPVIASNPQSDSQDLLAASTFDRILGRTGFSALEELTPESDELHRISFASALADLIATDRKPSVVFGIEGEWGIGKTTILKHVISNVRKRGLITVRFDAWNFRDPDRIIQNYFEQVQAALDAEHFNPEVAKAFRLLASAVGGLSEGRINRFFHQLLSSQSVDPSSEARDKLTKVLNALGRPVIVFVDDIERLEPAEARAALRAIRLMSDLPYLSHVIAYDGERLAKTLFPESEEDAALTRDYLAKIINVEFSVSAPDQTSRSALFENNLRPLFGLLTKEEEKTFASEFNIIAQDAVLAALPTPREIRRVATLTAWTWLRFRKGLNLADLLVLTTIKIRFPKVYRKISQKPDHFYNSEWSDNILRLTKDDVKKAREEFLKSLVEEEPRNHEVVARLLKIVFPDFFGESAFGSKKEARKLRKARHPEIFPRYLHYTYHSNYVPEAELESLAFSLRNISASPERIKLLTDQLGGFIDRQLISSFFQQWDLFLDELFEGKKISDQQVLSDIVDAVSQISPRLTFSREIIGASGKVAASRISKLFGSFQDTSEANDKIVGLIETTPEIRLAGEIALDAQLEEHQQPFGSLKPDKQRILDAFNDRILRELGPDRVFEFEDQVAAMAIFWTAPSKAIAELVYTSLKKRPTALSRLAGYYMSISFEPFHQGLRPHRNDLKDMVKRLEPLRVHELTSQLPLSTWPDELDQLRVKMFRQFIESYTKDKP